MTYPTRPIGAVLSLLLASAASADPPELTLPDPLDRAALIEAVLARNPSIAAAEEAIRQAEAMAPVAEAYPDPTLSLQTAPASIGSEHGFGLSLALKQALPWRQSRHQRRRLHELRAARGRAQLEQQRQALREATAIAFETLCNVEALLAINGQRRGDIETLGASAVAAYSAGRAPQRTMLAARTELDLVEAERLRLLRRRAVVVSRLNALMHRAIDAAVPSPKPRRSLPPKATPKDEAYRARPELAVNEQQQRSARADLARIRSDQRPRFSVGASYSSMWAQPTHQAMVGLSMSLPIQRQSRASELRAAEAKIEQVGQQRRGLEAALAAAQHQAAITLEEARARADLFRQRILPNAELTLRSIEAEYEAGRAELETLIGAYRQLRQHQAALANSVAEAWRQATILARATAAPLPNIPAPSGDQP